MSQIEIPDWVARKVLAGYLRDWDDCSESNKQDLAKIMAEALSAALEGWLVHEGWKYEGIYSSVPPFRKDRADGYTSPLYTIRKEPAA